VTQRRGPTAKSVNLMMGPPAEQMITQTFLLQLLLSCVFGGGWIALMTVLAERLGSKVGGLLLMLPSTILVSLFFIGVTQGSDAVVQITTILPATLTTSVILLIAFTAAYRYGPVAAYTAGYVAWFVFGLTWVLLRIPNIWLALGLALLMLAAGIGFFSRRPHMNLPAFRLSPQALTLRYLFAGVVVGGAVLLSHLLGPLWGALFASFPATVTSTLVVLERSHGIDFTTAVARSMCNGIGVNLVFVLIVFLIGPTVGFVAAIGLGYLASIGSTLLIHRLTTRAPGR
jgi:hypothetical protein